jgi:hypothetical protein
MKGKRTDKMTCCIHLQYNRSFNRMGGQTRYATADNRDLLLAIVKGLEK